MAVSETRHVSRTATLAFAAPPSTVFPLFGPDREADWAYGWSPEAVSASGVAPEPGLVFRTLHGGSEEIWVIGTYSPEQHLIEYITFRAGTMVRRITVQVAPAAVGGSLVRVTYTLTALSKSGEAQLAVFTDEHYKRFMAGWQRQIDHFLATGQALRDC